MRNILSVPLVLVALSAAAFSYDPPLVIDQPGTHVLSGDLSCDGSAVLIRAKDVRLDLNGHTVTYDQCGGGVPNNDFEVAGDSDDIALNWDMSGAPGAKRVSTWDDAMFGRWCLQVNRTGSEQVIRSELAELPTHRAVVFWFRDNAGTTRDAMECRVEDEDGTTVAGVHDEDKTAMDWPAIAGRYRVSFRVLPPPDKVWSPQTTYWVGDRIMPTVPNGAYYELKSVDGVSTSRSGTNEPAWSDELGALVEDNGLLWRTSFVNVLRHETYSMPWEPNKEYAIGSFVSPVEHNGCSYRLVRTATTFTTGDDEPDWRDPPYNADTIEGPARWKIKYLDPVRIDWVGLCASRVHGITRDGYQIPHGVDRNITVTNGRVVQGDGRSYQSHAVELQGPGVTVTDLELLVCGPESAAIHGAWQRDYLIADNRITSTNPIKHNRRQLSAAIVVARADNVKILRNTISSGEGWGGIYAGTVTNSLVSENTVRTSSVITNHYGILTTGDHNVVRGNTVVADPGQGMRLDGTHNVLENNTITIKSVAPNWDLGRYSLDGIRNNDYGNGTNRHQVTRGNVVTVYGRNSPHYKREEQIAVGICNVSHGPGNRYEGNVIDMIRVDPEIKVYGVQPGATDNLVSWSDNTIRSDDRCISFGGYAATSLNTRFERTTFRRGDNPTDGWSVIGNDGGRWESVANTRFVDSVCEAGTLLTVDGPTWWKHTHEVASTITIVVTKNNRPVRDESVLITDCTGLEWSGQTDAEGRTTVELLSATVSNRGGEWAVLRHTPHVVDVRDQSVSIVVDGPRTITIELKDDQTVDLEPWLQQIEYAVEQIRAATN